MCLLLRFAICGSLNHLGSEISRWFQICYLWCEIWRRRDYLGSDISSISLSKPFSWYQVVFQKRWSDYLGSDKIA